MAIEVVEMYVSHTDPTTLALDWFPLPVSDHPFPGAGLKFSADGLSYDVGTIPGSGVLVNADDIAIDRSVVDNWYPALPPMTPTSPADGDSILWDPDAGTPPGTGGWVYGPGGATVIDELYDVNTLLQPPTDDQALAWSSTSLDELGRLGQWIPAGPHLKLAGGTLVNEATGGTGIDTAGAPISNVRYNPAGPADITGVSGLIVEPGYAASIQYVDDLVTMGTVAPTATDIPKRDGLLWFVTGYLPPRSLTGKVSSTTTHDLIWTEPSSAIPQVTEIYVSQSGVWLPVFMGAASAPTEVYIRADQPSSGGVDILWADEDQVIQP